MRIVIAGGGTAGHVNPAIALAHALEGHDVTFIGTARGAEAKLVPAAGFSLVTIDVRGFDRAKPLSLVPVGARAVRAIAQARRAMATASVDIVVGMGGYVSLPANFAAASKRVPIVLHEQNIVLGLANRVCLPLARKIATSFEATLERTGRKGVFVGNPVLPSIAKMDAARERERGMRRWGLDPGRKTLLVFGGSQGARRINEAAAGLASEWGDRGDRQVLHITGRVPFDRPPGAGRGGPNGIVFRSVEYVDEMSEAYAVADLAVCRGGATSVAELGAVGLPAVIVPYPYHRDRQQERHGRVMAVAGAAIVLPDPETTSDALARIVDPLFSDDSELVRMRKSAQSFGRPDAAEALARVIHDIA